jgi:hypothetical protein
VQVGECVGERAGEHVAGCVGELAGEHVLILIIKKSL